MCSGGNCGPDQVAPEHSTAEYPSPVTAPKDSKGLSPDHGTSIAAGAPRQRGGRDGGRRVLSAAHAGNTPSPDGDVRSRADAGLAAAACAPYATRVRPSSLGMIGRCGRRCRRRQRRRPPDPGEYRSAGFSTSLTSPGTCIRPFFRCSRRGRCDGHSVATTENEGEIAKRYGPSAAVHASEASNN